MIGVEFFGNFDLASAAIWAFWGFFAFLIYYLQTENMREGYPLEGEEDHQRSNPSLFPLPKEKTFILPHGGGEVTVPSQENEDRHRRKRLALKKAVDAPGAPYEPTGNPLVDGVGPASWVPRRDVPELDAKGHPKIVPMAKLKSFSVSAGRDPRGMRVQAGDGEPVGLVSDMWVDEPEQLVRYLEIELTDQLGGGKRLVPIQLAKIRTDRVRVHALYEAQFAGIPKTKSSSKVTLLEEEKICAYVGGGKLYADPARLEPQL